MLATISKHTYYAINRLTKGVTVGHYASEMDSNWGKPSASEIVLAEVEDERIKALAGALFRGFNMSPHLEYLHAENGVRVAQAIDELIKARVEEALGVVSQPPTQ